MKTERTERGSRWFNIGVGLAEIAATRLVSKAIQLERKPGLLRLFGGREMATGVGILGRGRRAPWVWARVAGDVVDLLSLGSALLSTRRSKARRRIATALAAVAGVTALDLMHGRRMSKAH